MDHLTSLPPELIFHIASFLPPIDLTSFSSVNKYLREISWPRYVWLNSLPQLSWDYPHFVVQCAADDLAEISDLKKFYYCAFWRHRHILGRWRRLDDNVDGHGDRGSIDVRLDMQLGGIVGFKSPLSDLDLDELNKMPMFFFAPIDVNTYECDLNKADCTSCDDGDKTHNISIQLKKNGGLFIQCTCPRHFENEGWFDRSRFNRLSLRLLGHQSRGGALFQRDDHCVYGQHHSCWASPPEKLLDS